VRSRTLLLVPLVLVTAGVSCDSSRGPAPGGNSKDPTSELSATLGEHGARALIEAHGYEQKLTILRTWAGERPNPSLSPAVEELIATQITRGLGPDEKLSLVIYLRDHGNEWLAFLLVPLLKDSESKVRRNAVWLLGKWGRRAEEIAHTLQDGDSDVRFHAAEALARLGGERNLELLIPLLDDPDPRVHTMIADTMLAASTAENAAQLVRLLEFPDHSWRVIERLDQLGAVQEAPRIAELLKDESHETRRAAAMALGKLEATGYAEQVAALLRDPSRSVRLEAIWVLAELGTGMYAKDMLPFLTMPDAEFQQRAVLAIGHLKAIDLADHVAPLLSAPDYQLRACAAQTLGELPSNKSLSHLKAAHESEADPRVLKVIENAIGRVRLKLAQKD
jgi:HEAT repeat protein